ncbi:GIY-YIG nuclease family protein [Pedobacter sp. SYSU D00535]|uniref:GIY-YIG nuclease family protein n=1 Tax=Pedobacter sp. SYSU D00535 TaxID=2810308 RepID=UPI001A96F326|nr:GIY-YIG nuclease family protein [Pedobacter sp. SYSU D00535]
MEKGGCVYMMTNTHKTTLYIGVTSDLVSRIRDHMSKKYKNSFTAKYNLHICVYYEYYPRIEEAIEREKELKKWSRKKKNALIKSQNPEWENLWDEIKKW